MSKNNTHEVNRLVGIEVEGFNRRLSRGSQAATAEAWISEVTNGELGYLLVHGGGHIFDIVTRSLTAKESGSLQLVIQRPENSAARPLATFQDGAEEITFVQDVRQMDIARKLFQFLSREFQAGRTMITIAARVLLTKETTEETEQE
jgi:hypothetical protein